MVASSTSSFSPHPSPCANHFLLCLVHQTNYLLDQLLRLEEGGFTERLYTARQKARFIPRPKFGRANRSQDEKAAPESEGVDES